MLVVLRHPAARRDHIHVYIPLYHTGAGYDRIDYSLRKILQRERGGSRLHKNESPNPDSTNTTNNS